MINQTRYRVVMVIVIILLILLSNFITSLFNLGGTLSLIVRIAVMILGSGWIGGVIKEMAHDGDIPWLME